MPEKPRNMIGPYYILPEEEGIGEGISGTIRLAQNPATGERAALKTFNKTITRKLKEGKKEIRILSNVEYNNIVKLTYVEEDIQFIYMFTEYCEKGDLYSHIEKYGYFEEQTAKKLFLQMVNAIEHCHKRLHLCHHDVKLENFVVDGQMNVKLIDF